MGQELLATVIKHYLGSSEFKGYVLSGWGPDRIRKTVGPLIEEGLISSRFGDLDVNPSIRRFSDPPIRTQIEALQKSDLSFVALYPTKRALAKRVKPAKYVGRPFALRLARGEAHLDFCCFDLRVLEFYRNDPRYYYSSSDVFGTIYVHDEGMQKSDRIFLRFGFGYDESGSRAALAFLTDLQDLTPEHQQIWNTRVLSGKWMMHPDYHKSMIRGVFGNHIPILNAFGAELRHINAMCKLMGKPPLFHATFEREERPRGFSFLIRPTLKEFHDFVHLLDKALAENLNKDFFKRDIAVEEEIVRSDGKIEVRQIGTLRLLENWLQEHWVGEDPEPVRKMFEVFREIRNLRQTPAHKVMQDTFDQSYFKKQQDLIRRSYNGVRLLRLIFAQHPSVKGYKVEEALLEGRIRDF